jgi:Helicase HerA, central domain
MDNAPIHRELLLPAPTQEPSTIAPIAWNTSNPFWLEIHREPGGRVRYSLGSDSSIALEGFLSHLENNRPRLMGGRGVECAAASLVPEGVYARAVPVLKHHHFPIQIPRRIDPAGFLLRTLNSRTLDNHDVVLQFLFQRSEGWESTFFSPLFENVARRQTHAIRSTMQSRLNDAAYHLELRAHLTGPRPEDGLEVLGTWLGQWTIPGGATWRRWRVVPPKKEYEFHAALAAHDLRKFRSRKARRDVSGLELAHLLSIPWADHHGECSYAGAPRGHPSPDHIARTSRAHPELRLVVGQCGAQHAVLPSAWNHLAILGRTQSGKSTLALSLVVQILSKEPGSTVVVIEPTGTLVDGIVSRLHRETASETVEIDPAHATFQQGDATMVSVPLSLLLPPERANEALSARDRWAEALAGDLLTAIRSAWGEESIGGRAELVLRALVQGLALTPGSNLVDAYHVLTSKPALQRFVKSAPAGPLREFLEHHLPRLDYNFTMSTLDKVGKIATNPLLRVALCQRDRSVTFDRLLGHRLLLLNLSKSALGADGANFLGAIYLTQLWAAVQRSGRPDHPVYLVLDEVHNYAVPALADMLSEGAKFGLHVVSITQYLHRVPPRIRAALLGNVDGWLLFSLGTEDMDDAWKIVNGESHGWLPQDLVDGLRPHEVAMSVSGDLLKLSTRPGPPPDPHASDLKELVIASSRRYAQPEDSEASPWLVEQDDLKAVLNGLAQQSRTPDELGAITNLRPDRLAASLRRSEEARDVESDSDEPGHVRLTPRGSVHLRALLARRNEGEDHVETLVDLCMLLDSRGIAATIPEQVAGVLMPDAQFRYGDAVYNVEVECSTVVKASEQVVRNVRKAREAGRQVLIVLPDASKVPKLLAVLDCAFPGNRLWPDGVGLVWRDQDGTFHPHRVPGTEVWPFLADDPTSDFDTPEDDNAQAIEDPSDPVADTDPLVRQIRGVIGELLAAQKTEATIDDLHDRLPIDARPSATDKRVGKVLALLGLPCRRVKEKGVRFRVYTLTGPTPQGGPDGVRTGDPSEGPDAIRGSAGPENGSARRVPDFSSEDSNRDPRARRDPND